MKKLVLTIALGLSVAGGLAGCNVKNQVADSTNEHHESASAPVAKTAANVSAHKYLFVGDTFTLTEQARHELMGDEEQQKLAMLAIIDRIDSAEYQLRDFAYCDGEKPAQEPCDPTPYVSLQANKILGVEFVHTSDALRHLVSELDSMLKPGWAVDKEAARYKIAHLVPQVLNVAQIYNRELAKAKNMTS
ncbi:hypothetical protein ISM37_004513 [Salmonella enterica]|nr:hypothetical protein [Salmonella enterica]EGN7527256.1 hypothetical protein [Salmonella enterica]EGO6832876.1 hypothetical protein [Salmonella enterica]EGO6840263.1 hypothetical protein [Salmonella enterica]EGO6860192.1 hypothetical protein [Salmonella enterica]